VTIGGAGRLRADLTPQCTAALQAVVDALDKPAGPEDLRSKWQRQHDALEEACRRLLAAIRGSAGLRPRQWRWFRSAFTVDAPTGGFQPSPSESDHES
jgi:hypothetical protein